jgi:hypothetical protein
MKIGNLKWLLYNLIVSPSAPFVWESRNPNGLRLFCLGWLRLGCGWLRDIEAVYSTTVAAGDEMPADVHGNLDALVSQLLLQYNAGSIPSARMYAALNEQDFFCRAFGTCMAGDMLDRKAWDMIGKKSPVSPKRFTNLRYNAELSREGLDAMEDCMISIRRVSKSSIQ